MSTQTAPQPKPDEQATVLHLSERSERMVKRDRLTAALRVEATEFPHGAQGIDTAVANERGHARPAGVRDLVGAVVSVLPENLAGGGAEAKHAFGAGNGGARRADRFALVIHGANTIHDVDAVADHSRAAIARPDGCAPEHRRAAGRKLVHQTGLAPDAVTLLA